MKKGRHPSLTREEFELYLTLKNKVPTNTIARDILHVSPSLLWSYSHCQSWEEVETKRAERAAEYRNAWQKKSGVSFKKEIEPKPTKPSTETALIEIQKTQKDIYSVLVDIHNELTIIRKLTPADGRKSILKFLSGNN